MTAENLIHANLSESIIGAFLDSYYKLGYGFLESIYAAALTRELVKRGHRVQREVGVEVIYDGARIGWFRFDMIVDGLVIVEIKASELLPTFARRQLRNYLRATRLEVGLLLHYGPTPFIGREVYSRGIPRLPPVPPIL